MRRSGSRLARAWGFWFDQVIPEPRSDRSPGVEERDAAAAERLQARDVADLGRLGLGVEIAHQDRRKAPAQPAPQHEIADRLHLPLAHLAVAELPIQVRAGERERAERRVRASRASAQRRSPSPASGKAIASLSRIGKRLAIAFPNSPWLKARAFAPEARGRRVREVIAAVAEQLRDLIALRRAQRFLEADQVGREPIDPLAHALLALRPGARVVPQVQREHRERHQSQFGFIASG